MADNTTPAQPKTPGPKTASDPDHRRWRDVVERAQVDIVQKPVMALASDPNTESAVPSTPTVDPAPIPASTPDAHVRDTPWTGEVEPEAVKAEVIKSIPNDVEGGARSLLPDRPWGNPQRRLWFWLAALGTLVAAAFVLVSYSIATWLPVGLVAIVPVIAALRGIYVSGQERQIAQEPRAARNVKEKSPSSPDDGVANDEAAGSGRAPQPKDR
jgi:hypothetical protein